MWQLEKIDNTGNTQKKQQQLNELIYIRQREQHMLIELK